MGCDPGPETPGQRREIGRVSILRLCDIAARTKALQAKRANRLQHGEAWLAVAREWVEKALVHQRADTAQDRLWCCLAVRDDRLRRLQREVTWKDGQASKHRLLIRREE